MSRLFRVSPLKIKTAKYNSCLAFFNLGRVFLNFGEIEPAVSYKLLLVKKRVSVSSYNNNNSVHFPRKMVARWLWYIFVIISFITGISCMEDGVSYVVGSGKLDCFHRVIRNGTTLDFEMEVSEVCESFVSSHGVKLRI